MYTEDDEADGNKSDAQEAALVKNSMPRRLNNNKSGSF